MERSAVLIEHKSRLSVTCIIPELRHVCPIGSTPHWCLLIYASALREWILKVREVKSEMEIWFTHFEK